MEGVDVKGFDRAGSTVWIFSPIPPGCCSQDLFPSFGSCKFNMYYIVRTTTV